VRIGLTDLRTNEKAENSANIAEVTIHPKYTEIAGGKEGVKNDLAIVTLDRNVRTPPVCLAGTAEGHQKRGSKPVVIGFGKTVQSKHFGAQQDKLRSSTQVTPLIHSFVVRGHVLQVFTTKPRFAYLEEISNRECQNKYNTFYK
jgi:hypothetical protein